PPAGSPFASKRCCSTLPAPVAQTTTQPPSGKASMSFTKCRPGVVVLTWTSPPTALPSGSKTCWNTCSLNEFLSQLTTQPPSSSAVAVIPRRSPPTVLICVSPPTALPAASKRCCTMSPPSWMTSQPPSESGRTVALE